VYGCRTSGSYGLRVGKEDGAAFGRYLVRELANSTAYPNAAAFARSAGISHSSLSRWIAGTERPSIQVLARIAPCLDVDIRDLVAIAYPEAVKGAPAVAETEPLDPLVREVGLMLADDSPIPPDDRHALRTIVDRLVAPYRPQMRRRRKAAG
jgi:transcriptional regulator with XRE-family HTH domain